MFVYLHLGPKNNYKAHAFVMHGPWNFGWRAAARVRRRSTKDLRLRLVTLLVKIRQNEWQTTKSDHVMTENGEKLQIVSVTGIRSDDCRGEPGATIKAVDSRVEWHMTEWMNFNLRNDDAGERRKVTTDDERVGWRDGTEIRLLSYFAIWWVRYHNGIYSVCLLLRQHRN